MSEAPSPEALDESIGSEPPPEEPKTLGQRIAAEKERKSEAKAKRRGLDAERIEEKAEQKAEAAVGLLVEHGKTLGVAVAGVLAVVGGYFGWQEFAQRQKSGELTALSESLQIAAAPLRAEDQGAAEAEGLSFATRSERAQEALDLYRSFLKEHGPSRGSVWATLGQASSLLDLGKLSEARASFEKAAESTEPEAQLRALEGIGFSLEAEKKWAAAEKAFSRLKGLDSSAPGARDIADYHVARMKAARGEEQGALKILVALLERLGKPDADVRRLEYLKTQAELQVLALDPKALPDSATRGGPGPGSQLSQEQIQRLLEQLQQQQQQQAPATGGSEAPPSAPPISSEPPAQSTPQP